MGTLCMAMQWHDLNLGPTEVSSIHMQSSSFVVSASLETSLLIFFLLRISLTV